jgi:hypothetical protein
VVVDDDDLDLVGGSYGESQAAVTAARS